MSRLISKAEGFETAYQAFQNINFNAFDFYSIKQSMIEYIKLYHSETMNDFIESSEFIALVEVFAYLGEIMAYRFDMNAHEMSIQYATRKQSILRLAKLLSYKASRNVPARGLVKIDSIATSEKVYDMYGTDLSNKKIIWNDPTNSLWKEQFHVVLASVLQQKFGTVAPNERKQVDDILYELYPLSVDSPTLGVMKYTTTVSGNSYPMELVSSILTQYGPLEARPNNSNTFNIIYGSDGLGDSSPYTGFYIYTKQGTLSKRTATFDGIIPNQTYDIPVNNINNIDVWVNQIDPNTLETVDDNSDRSVVSGNWEEVDLTNAQNIIFNNSSNRNKYEVETLENDQIRVIFGDGQFSNIPSGTFEIWFRSSIDQLIYIPKSAILNKNGSLSYVDKNGRKQSFSFTFSLVSALQNNSPSETIEHIRQSAPATYYTQDRMVNGKDYNTYPLKDSSILKLRTVNRTFVGESMYDTKNDPSSTYQDVKVLGDDLAIFYKPSIYSVTAPTNIYSNVLVTNYIEPVLYTMDVYINSLIKHNNYRRQFTEAEKQQIISAIESPVYPWPISLSFYGGNVGDVFGQWSANTNEISQYGWDILISKSESQSIYTITYRGQHIVAESASTNFYYDNSDDRVLSLDTLNVNKDEIVILKANYSSDPNRLLSANYRTKVVDVERYDMGMQYTGLPNLHQLSILPYDDTKQLPTDIYFKNIMGTNFVVNLNDVITHSSPQVIELPQPYVVGVGDTSVPDAANIQWCEFGHRIYDIDKDTNTITVVGNITNVVSVNSIVNLVHTGGSNDGKYRVSQVNLNSSGFTLLTFYMDIDDANFDGTQPSIKTQLTLDGGQLGYVCIEGASAKSILVLSTGSTDTITIKQTGYVYFSRESVDAPFAMVESTPEILEMWYADKVAEQYVTRRIGRSGLNFMWLHRTTSYDIVDPSPTNINDMFIITNSYYSEIQKWLQGDIDSKPVEPTSTELKSAYAKIIENKMISDTVILHTGKIKILFGSKASPELQAKIKVIRTSNTSLTDNQLKIKVVNLVREFFDINDWQFGEVFYYTELDTYIQNSLTSEIASTVLVPSYPTHKFGDLYQIYAKEDEIFQVHISVDNVEIVSSFNSVNLKQN